METQKLLWKMLDIRYINGISRVFYVFFDNKNLILIIDLLQVSGEINLEGQYHFYMETQVARAYYDEELSFNLESATQWHTQLQAVLSDMLNIPNSR